MVLLWTITTVAVAQKRENHEFVKNMPVYMEQLIADLDYPLAWGNSKIKNFKKWKKTAREKVFECMLTPPPPAASYDMEVLAEEQRDGYKARKIAFNLSRYYRVTALLLIPDGKGPFPAVNALHDHGAHLYIGKEKMIRPFAVDSAVIKDADAWADNLYESQFFGDYLAKHGYVVFSADAPMWGERGRAEGVDRSKYDMIAGNMMMYGVDLSAYMTYDDIAGTDFLATLPEVDAERIGCVGCSMGAYRAWMLSALSDRIKVGAAICWMITSDVQLTTRYGRSENGGFANCIPGLRRYLDYPHIASLACPKPMLFVSGKRDKLFPLPGVEKAFGIMNDTWKSQGAADKLDTEIWDIPHSCPKTFQEKTLAFFKKYL
ncbi:MAG: dienelactone hydrolase family protein [Prevotella sp.]|nr:dienelactone hydrolase family protein [Prevotella sp.]